MTKTGTNVVVSGGNLTKFKEDIRAGANKIVALEKKRAGINADIGAVRKNLQAAGLHPKALAAMLAYFKMDDQQRDGFDEGYLISREAIGLPVQGAFDFSSKRSANGEDDDKSEESAGGTTAFGKQAGVEGKPTSDNPWPKGNPSHGHWHNGWLKGQAALAGQMKAPAKKSGRRKRPGKSAPV